jgi:hypothetical protein
LQAAFIEGGRHGLLGGRRTVVREVRSSTNQKPRENSISYPLNFGLLKLCGNPIRFNPKAKKTLSNSPKPSGYHDWLRRSSLRLSLFSIKGIVCDSDAESNASKVVDALLSVFISTLNDNPESINNHIQLSE